MGFCGSDCEGDRELLSFCGHQRGRNLVGGVHAGTVVCSVESKFGGS